MPTTYFKGDDILSSHNYKLSVQAGNFACSFFLDKKGTKKSRRNDCSHTRPHRIAFRQGLRAAPKNNSLHNYSSCDTEITICNGLNLFKQ
jgi:hypothetical protein